MLTIKLRDWKPDTVLKEQVPDAALQEQLELMLLHWMRCLPESHGMTPPEAVTLEVEVRVRATVEVPWCADLGAPQQVAQAQETT